jgi:hypothetical protein
MEQETSTLLPDVTAPRIVEVLRRRHQGPQWTIVEEMRLGSGWGFHESRIDFWALECTPRRANQAIAYEIKVSRADFLRDVRRPAKQRGALLYSNEFFYVSPAGVIKAEEVPIFAGLIEIDAIVPVHDEPYYAGTVIVRAPYRDKMRPSWPFIVSLLRRVPVAEGAPSLAPQGAKEGGA